MLSHAFIFKQAAIVGKNFASAVYFGWGGGGGEGGERGGREDYLQNFTMFQKTLKMFTDFQDLFLLTSWKYECSTRSTRSGVFFHVERIRSFVM